MKVLTCSRFFPKGHIREGQPTHFVEKILRGIYELRDETKPIMDMHVWANCVPKLHTIRKGERWKVGEIASLRVWSGIPYGKGTTQIEFAQVEVKKTWEFIIAPPPASYQTDEIWVTVGGRHIGCFHPALVELEVIANNDGVSIEDFISWFAIHPKKQGAEFRGQIISWSDQIEY